MSASDPLQSCFNQFCCDAKAVFAPAADVVRFGPLIEEPMRRREFITLVSGAAAWPIAVRGQPRTMPVIGFLNPGSQNQLASRIAAFRAGLTELGYVEGKNVTIEYRWADGLSDRVPALAADLVRRGVDVIAATGGTANIAKAATSVIPIVFTTGADPVAIGFVDSLNRPGGNITGITMFSGPAVSKRIGLLRELLPDAKHIAILMDPNFRPNQIELTVADEAAVTLGWRVKVFRASSAGELEEAFQLLARERADALLVTTNAIFESRRDRIVTLVSQVLIPSIYPLREYPLAGGLMSYGASVTQVYRVAGQYVARILKGEKPADLPVQLPTKFEFLINLRHSASRFRQDYSPRQMKLWNEVGIHDVRLRPAYGPKGKVRCSA
jgi:putative ABC transport system substrate-binding protein